VALAKDKGDLTGDKWDLNGWCGGVIEGIGSGECRSEWGEWVKSAWRAVV